jgi:methanogenic corrinoid protein MtbC1
MSKRDEGGWELSIGALSQATGVPVETLRTWERRYGFPEPISRSDGGHRRYPAQAVGTVRLIVQALDQGHRAASVLGLSDAQLRMMLGIANDAGSKREERTAEDRMALQQFMELTLQLEGKSLIGAFQVSLAQLGAIDFLERRMAPYVTEVGEAWARGELRILHEHFASEQVREFLSQQWRTLAESIQSAGGPCVVLAAPPGEEHVLGLHMVAWAVVLGGVRVVFLGANTPMVEVALAAHKHRAVGVALGVARGYRGDLRAELASLRGQLGSSISVVVGGGGAREQTLTDQYLNTFQSIQDWADQISGGCAN